MAHKIYAALVAQSMVISPYTANLSLSDVALAVRLLMQAA